MLQISGCFCSVIDSCFRSQRVVCTRLYTRIGDTKEEEEEERQLLCFAVFEAIRTRHPHPAPHTAMPCWGYSSRPTDGALSSRSFLPPAKRFCGELHKRKDIDIAGGKTSKHTCSAFVNALSEHVDRPTNFLPGRKTNAAAAAAADATMTKITRSETKA